MQGLQTCYKLVTQGNKINIRPQGNLMFACIWFLYAKEKNETFFIGLNKYIDRLTKNLVPHHQQQLLYELFKNIG